MGTNPPNPQKLTPEQEIFLLIQRTVSHISIDHDIQRVSELVKLEDSLTELVEEALRLSKEEPDAKRQ